VSPAAAGDRVLVGNVTHFARLLRRAGLPIGTDRILGAVDSLEAVGLDRRDDVYWALHASLVSRRDQHEIFDRAFELFFRERGGLEDALAAMSPTGSAPADDRRSTPRRLREAFASGRRPQRPPPQKPFDATLAASDVEVLRDMDFAEMSAEELRRAAEVVRHLPLALETRPTRRLRADPRGARLDLRAMLRDSLRTGGDHLPLRFRGRVRRPPPLVAICDISGSMERYVRILLHFLHALTNARDRVEVFLFGTRLSHVTRVLHQRDPDVALAQLGGGGGRPARGEQATAGAVLDWSGGTRIGASLRVFNRRHARRLLGHGAVVLLITDGLERESPELLEIEAARLSRSCRRLVWLNPLLRYSGFEPRARGVAALLPHVDELRPVHDLSSLDDLARALAGEPIPAWEATRR
jgi:uncharacterized protein with von Willebrand factor type A (vWA) domain